MNKFNMYLRGVCNNFYMEVLKETVDDIKASFAEFKNNIEAYKQYRIDKKNQKIDGELKMLDTLSREVSVYETHLFDKGGLTKEQLQVNERNLEERLANLESTEKKYFKHIVEQSFDIAEPGMKKSDVYLELAKGFYDENERLHKIIFIVDDQALFEDKEFLDNLVDPEDMYREGAGGKAITIDETNVIRVLDSSRLSPELVRKIEKSNLYRGCIDTMKYQLENMKKNYLNALYEEYDKESKKNGGNVSGDYKKCFDLTKTIESIDKKRMFLLTDRDKNDYAREIRAEMDWQLLQKRAAKKDELNKETRLFVKEKIEGKERENF